MSKYNIYSGYSSFRLKFKLGNLYVHLDLDSLRIVGRHQWLNGTCSWRAPHTRAMDTFQTRVSPFPSLLFPSFRDFARPLPYSFREGARALAPSLSHTHTRICTKAKRKAAVKHFCDYIAKKFKAFHDNTRCYSATGKVKQLLKIRRRRRHIRNHHQRDQENSYFSLVYGRLLAGDKPDQCPVILTALTYIRSDRLSGLLTTHWG